MTQKMVEEGGGDELGPFWRGCDASTKTEKTWEFEQTRKMTELWLFKFYQYG